MKIADFFVFFVLFTCAINLTACDDRKEETPNQIYPLIFEKDSFEIRKGIVADLHAISCNGYNTLKVETGDTAILQALPVILENGTSHASGWIRLMGKEKGCTQLMVYDRIAKESAVLNIKVTDYYLGMQIRGTNHPLFSQQNAGFLFLVDNGQKDFYLFGTKDQQPAHMLQKGMYHFTMENNVPYLTLAIDDGGLSASCKFNLSGNENKVYALLSHYFHLDWEQFVLTGTKALNSTIQLRMKEENTDYEVFMAITDSQIPEGVLE